MQLLQALFPYVCERSMPCCFDHVSVRRQVENNPLADVFHCWRAFYVISANTRVCVYRFYTRLSQGGAYNVVVFRGNRGVDLCAIFYESRTSCSVHRQHGYSWLCMCSLCTDLCVRCTVVCIIETAVLGVFMLVVNMAFTFTVQCVRWYNTYTCIVVCVRVWLYTSGVHAAHVHVALHCTTTFVQVHCSFVFA